MRGVAPRPGARDLSHQGTQHSALRVTENVDTLAVEALGERGAMGEPQMELPQGTLDVLILKALALEPLHGWAVSERLQQISGDALRVQQGSLYPALHRLERRGWIKAQWAVSENNRRAKYYELTRLGRKQLESETAAWRRLTAVVGQVLDLA
jgi:PadR family transcriptional regulator, regulatory protein PadR